MNGAAVSAAPAAPPDAGRPATGVPAGWEGADRRRRDRRRPLISPVTEWDRTPSDRQRWSGPERRRSDRRTSGSPPFPPVTLPGEPEYYSDDWARRRGALSFLDWLDRLAQPPPRIG